MEDWLDNSKIELVNLCPRKYFYRHKMNIVPLAPVDIETGIQQVDYATPMNFGSAIHQALASYYSGEGFERVTCPCPEYCEFCLGNPIPRMLAMFLLYYPQDPSDPRDTRTRRIGVELLIGYVKKWGREDFEVVAVEIPFAIPFDEFKYVGRIDLLMKEHGKLKPMDHKTAGRFGMMFEQQFKISGQLTGYMKGVSQICGEPITEGEINAIRTSKYIDLNESYLRLTTARVPEDFLEWERNVRSAYARINMYDREGYWPKHAPAACSMYNRQCEYYRLCVSHGQVRENQILASYEINVWNPVDHGQA